MLAVLCLLSPAAARAADLNEARTNFFSGAYSNCITACELAIRNNEYDEEWRRLLAKAFLAVGEYQKAEQVITTALDRYGTSIPLRLLAHEVLLQNGHPEHAQALLSELNYLASSRVQSYGRAPDLVALGQAALLLGADARKVLDNFFNPAKQADPAYRETYVAIGELALAKNDFDLAATTFGDGLKRFPYDADMHFGLARAFAPSDWQRTVAALESALAANTNHVPTCLLLADHLIDSEDYRAARRVLDRALAVNPSHPEAWAYRAVLAHLASDTNAESRARVKALAHWPSNPEVDHIIGRKLSQNYRFAEGAACQRQALRFDAKFLPAKIQLAQDLLRLGQETEGWRLAEEVHKQDGYDVEAYNLVTLRGNLAKFQSLTNGPFVLRMAPLEASLYGTNALQLLQQAKERLCAKYGLTLEEPTVVEIFPDPKDFGVRTFGMPGNPGYLGVCFGSVITANSPASQTAHPANWQAVLWHEFCHVVTLHLTHNKMPRWLSEGISVYEERQANPVWGESLNPSYREMILGGELTPVGELSAAFLSPKSGLHLQFAYYESSLVVEFLVQRFGLDSLRSILQDLGTGAAINDAIAKRTEPMEKIEKEFAAFAREHAEKLAPGLDWEAPKITELLSGGIATLAAVPPAQVKTNTPADQQKRPARGPAPSRGMVNAPLMLGEEALTEWIARHPTNFYALTEQARRLAGQKKFQEAKAPLQKLIELYPAQKGEDSAYVKLAEVHRALGETNQEREVLVKLAAVDADATDVFLRLMELFAAAKDWPAVAENAERFLAVNPLVPQPHRYRARANEELGKIPEAISAYQSVLLFDPMDPAEVHFHLAKLMRQAGDPAAKRQVLQALEEAPRFREAQRLLLDIAGDLPRNQTNGAAVKQSADR